MNSVMLALLQGKSFLTGMLDCVLEVSYFPLPLKEDATLPFFAMPVLPVGGESSVSLCCLAGHVTCFTYEAEWT